jgi:hypothetical protein
MNSRWRLTLALQSTRSIDMPLRPASLRNIAARAAGVAVVIALLGFYPAYLGTLHHMCDVIKGKVVRYL